MAALAYEKHQCQMCGAYIGYVGRAFQAALGCGLVLGCRGSRLQRQLMGLPTTRWLIGVVAIAAIAASVIIFAEMIK